MITGKLYDWLKWIAQVALPGLGTLYFTLAGLWGLPNADEVVGTIVAIDLFLGLLLGISQVQFNKQIAHAGDLLVQPDGKMVFQIDEDKTDIEKLKEKKEVRFKVQEPLQTGRHRTGGTSSWVYQDRPT